MAQSASFTQINRRQESGSTPTTVIIVLVAVLAFLILSSVSLWLYWRSRRRQAQKAQGYSKRQTWRESFASLSSGFQRAPPVRPDVSDPNYTELGHEMVNDPEAGNLEDGAAVDRHTSVRSVITLPAYSATPSTNDTVIAREGERGGIDRVVAFPETVDEEEERREEEMDTLWQIRQLRRHEAAERAERRVLRRAARDRGDWATVRALRQDSHRAAERREVSGSAALIVEHESRPRERRVSAVEYGELGVARHDGSRMRANSNDSDRPLLETAGPLGISGPPRPWLSHEGSRSHRRGRSSQSNLSVTTFDSDDHSGISDADSDFDDFSQHSRSHSRQTLGHSRTASSTRSRSTSNAATLMVQTDIGESRIPEPEPPAYETVSLGDAPPYTSPVDQRQPRQLPSGLSISTTHPVRLPSIRISAGTPIDPHADDFPDFSRYTFNEH